MHRWRKFYISKVLYLFSAGDILREESDGEPFVDELGKNSTNGGGGISGEAGGSTRNKGAK